MLHGTSMVPYLGLLVLIIAVKLGSATIGYDCGREIQNSTTMSLIEIEDCDLKNETVDITSEEIVLLELNRYHETEVIQCKVEVYRKVYLCRMWSHRSIINEATYIREITGEACKHAHKDLRITINGHIIENLKINGTVLQNIVMAGSIANDGACELGSFTDTYGIWREAVVTGDIKVTLKSAFVRADVESDIIHLQSGVRCKLSAENCIDSDGGYTFWKSVPTSGCSDYTYSRLYDGNSTKFVSKQETIYSVNVDETSFSLKVTGTEKSCGVKLFRTESSKIFLMRRQDIGYLERSHVINMNYNGKGLFQYVNDKFLYVERHIRTEIKSLYFHMMRHQCKLEKERLKELLDTTLAIASTQPDEFAYRYMEAPGYMAIFGGEVIHIVQCVPVPVRIRNANKCYNRLPVWIGNDTAFLTPKTHVITNYATEVSCTKPVPEIYRIQGEWYKFVPMPVLVESPTSLKASTKLTWEYLDIGDLMNDGIYSSEDLVAIGKRIMFPLEQTVVAADIATQFTKGLSEPISFSNIFDENLKEELAEDVLSKMWGKFVGLGKVCSGFFGIFVIFSLLKIIANSVTNGIALKKSFGWSFKMFGCLCDSLTNILIENKKKEKKQMRAYLPTSKLIFNEKVDDEILVDDEMKNEMKDPETEDRYDVNACEAPIPAPRRQNAHVAPSIIQRPHNTISGRQDRRQARSLESSVIFHVRK